MKPRVYVETSILSYLTALPSRDVIQAARQQVTIGWWARRDEFELFLSDPVLTEARRGDPAAAARRLGAAAGIAVLSGAEEAETLAAALIKQAAMPAKAIVDAAHVAIATVHGLDFLLTWNFTHIANATMRPRIESCVETVGFDRPSSAHQTSCRHRRRNDSRCHRR
ncbi:type II toxin-antitoxin system VapC family toxin [Sorangium sp. So ce204]|uniref:type II toxin-antitoxin system VapC family toxin n=1 Tax=Sorangium sp. So ce204 TaxID=3133288 RepID=UPI003F648C97